MANPRRQGGWLRVERGSWLGTWRVYTGLKKTERRSVVLGIETGMTREQAQERLSEIISEDQQQCNFVRKIRPGMSPVIQRKLNPSLPMHATNIGLAAELIVALDLTMQGFHVYKAMSPTAPCDLIYCDSEDSRVRVEVKSLQYRKDRSPRINVARNAGKFDVLAVVDKDGRVHYQTHNGIGKTVQLFLDNSDLQLTRKAPNAGK